jgi:hypothetical protein
MTDAFLDSESHPQTPSNSMSKTQGYILIGLFCVGIALAAWGTFKPYPKYEYKVLSLLAESNERTGSGALKYASVNVDQAQLQTLTGEGWELVDSFLEMETAFPNFGNSEYVTGLQPNVRPQRAVLLFKRPVR